MKIYKYSLSLVDTQKISIREKMVKPLFVGEQNGELVIWLQLSTDDYTCISDVYIDIVGTGHEFETSGKYLNSVQKSDGYVWHIFTDISVRRFK